MNYIKLTYDKLDATEISELAAHESCGAVSLFIGTTRDNFENKQVD
jgi:molybdopterin synthase catalytic subunit